jgi:hypothetical protein
MGTARVQPNPQGVIVRFESSAMGSDDGTTVMFTGAGSECGIAEAGPGSVSDGERSQFAGPPLMW